MKITNNHNDNGNNDNNTKTNNSNNDSGNTSANIHISHDDNTKHHTTTGNDNDDSALPQVQPECGGLRRDRTVGLGRGDFVVNITTLATTIDITVS